jgi:hypothetical protein
MGNFLNYPKMINAQSTLLSADKQAIQSYSKDSKPINSLGIKYSKIGTCNSAKKVKCSLK